MTFVAALGALQHAQRGWCSKTGHDSSSRLSPFPRRRRRGMTSEQETILPSFSLFCSMKLRYQSLAAVAGSRLDPELVQPAIATTH